MKLEIKGLTKRFGGFTANDAISLTVEPGEIHAILGENGAGKSTLMNMLYGLLDPDEGEILLDGVPARFKTPGDAIDAGIGMVHQHFMLIPVFTVSENVMLGREQTRGPGLLDRAKAAERVRELSKQYGLRVNPKSIVADLPVGVQQRVEIIKALANDAGVLILDEPTAVLIPQEIDELLEIMRQLKAAGTSIVFISHKLKEVKAAADRITVIRRGKVVGETGPEASEAELAEMMVGRAVSLTTSKEQAVVADEVLDISGLTVVDDHGYRVVDDVSLQVRGGEILGIAGVQGNGQTELVKAIVGLVPSTHGRITVNGVDITRSTPRECLDVGIGYVPEDRQHDGFVASFSVAENLVLDRYRSDEFSHGISMQLSKISENASQRIAEFDIRTQSPDAPMGSLSGGNQQKVVVAREMSRPLKLLLVSQPTRGLDVGSIEFVHNRVIAERDAGVACLMVSTELDEIVGLSDRIAVMYHGKIVGVVPPDTEREGLGLMMAGAERGAVTTAAAGAKEAADE
ncbi:MAG: ABC transporter ATP-binding protein [Nocardioidaceae bacterium]